MNQTGNVYFPIACISFCFHGKQFSPDCFLPRFIARTFPLCCVVTEPKRFYCMITSLLSSAGSHGVHADVLTVFSRRKMKISLIETI